MPYIVFPRAHLHIELWHSERFHSFSWHSGGLAPILGLIYGKVPEWEFFFLTDSSKLSLDTQKLILVEISKYYFLFRRVIDRLGLQKQFYMWGYTNQKDAQGWIRGGESFIFSWNFGSASKKDMGTNFEAVLSFKSLFEGVPRGLKCSYSV